MIEDVRPVFGLMSCKSAVEVLDSLCLLLISTRIAWSHTGLSAAAPFPGIATRPNAFCPQEVTV
jgi:hypothetical protein